GGQVAALAQDDDKPTLRVGSKNFTEQFIMNGIVALKLEDAGYPVEREFGLGGTAVLMEAVFADQIDVFMEYSGTGYMAMLNLELPTEEELGDTSIEDYVYEKAKEGYEEEYDLTWLDVWGYNNT